MSNVTTLLDAKSVPAVKTALICPSRNEVYSDGKLREEMNRIGLGLSTLGIKKGDRVCIYLDSSPEYLISYFAIWRIGAVAVPTNIVYRGEGVCSMRSKMRSFCDHYGLSGGKYCCRHSSERSGTWSYYLHRMFL